MQHATSPQTDGRHRTQAGAGTLGEGATRAREAVVEAGAPELYKEVECLLGDERMVSGERVAAHCHATVGILAGLGLAATGKGQSLASLMWLAAALPLLGPGFVEHRAGPRMLMLAAALRSLFHLQTLRLIDGRGALAERESVRRMFFEMSKDPQLVLLSLASRLQTLRFHAASASTPDLDSCRFTLQILAPLGSRLGLGRLTWELEDLAFRFAAPDRYREIAAILDEKRSRREAFVEALVGELRLGLAPLGLDPSVSGRPKNIYSIHQKMKAKAVGFERLLDLRACRVIVCSVDACYAALDWIHQRFTPLLAEFDDYIARPKANGYRSLHTVVLHDDGRPFEVQIRTEEMDREAECGAASHWEYKELSTGVRGDKQSGPDRGQISYVRQLLAWQSEIAQEHDEGREARTIFVLTPMGKVLELPMGATPLDFAYAIHTELGHRCRGARVDEVMVPLNTPLRSGQTVEIVAPRHTTRRADASASASPALVERRTLTAEPRVSGTATLGGRQAAATSSGHATRAGERLGPSRDWLNPRLGYLKTPRARAKVRQWFHALDEERDQAIGRAGLIRLMRRESAMGVSFDELARLLRYVSPWELCLAFARGEVGVRAVEQGLRQAKGDGRIDGFVAERPRNALHKDGARGCAVARVSGVLVEGVGSLMTQVARCCQPAPPIPIVGFVTRGNGVSVHRQDCATVLRLCARHPERQIGTQWVES